MCPQPISGVPGIRSSCDLLSFSVIGCVLVSRIVFLAYGYCGCAPPELAFGGDDHGCSDGRITPLKIRNLTVFDAGTTSRDSWLIEASKLAWKIATSSTLKPVRL